MKYTFKKNQIIGKGLNRLEKAVVEDINSQDEPETYLKDVLQGGCISGTVSCLIYYTDTLAWFKKYRKEIEDLVTQYENDFGQPIDTLNGWDKEDRWARDTTNQNILAWFSYESICSDIANELELN